MPILSRVSTDELDQIAVAMINIAEDSSSAEECAQRASFHLFDNLTDEEEDPACVLVRCFRTTRFSNLSTELKDIASTVARDDELAPHTQCLVLMGSAGQNSQWNSRHKSESHRVIPLLSPEMVARSPMIAQLFRQMGIDVHDMLQPSDESLLGTHDRTLEVFYVPDAQGSAHIPAQAEFVIPYGVQSVIGFGGVLPSASVFAVIVFTRVHVDREVAIRFSILANAMKAALAQFDGENTPNEPVAAS
jgi:hypothetical protein